MGTIRNRMVIVHHYDLETIKAIREDAVQTFQSLVKEDYKNSEYDVDKEMISPILTSLVNSEYSFVIMGDCSKLGWSTSELFENGRNEWVEKCNRKLKSYKILVLDFGEDYECIVKEV